MFRYERKSLSSHSSLQSKGGGAVHQLNFRVRKATKLFYLPLPDKVPKRKYISILLYFWMEGAINAFIAPKINDLPGC